MDDSGNILSNLSDAKEFAKDQDLVKRLEQGVRKSLVTDSLLKHEGIRMLIDLKKQEIDRIDHRLKTLWELTELERKILLVRKEWNQEFINLFERSKKRIQATSERLKEIQ